MPERLSTPHEIAKPAALVRNCLRLCCMPGSYRPAEGGVPSSPPATKSYQRSDSRETPHPGRATSFFLDSRTHAKCMAVRMPKVELPDAPGFIRRWPGHDQALLQRELMCRVNLGR